MFKKCFFFLILMSMSFYTHLVMGQTTQTVYSKNAVGTITYVAEITTQLDGNVSIHISERTSQANEETYIFICGTSNLHARYIDGRGFVITKTNNQNLWSIDFEEKLLTPILETEHCLNCPCDKEGSCPMETDMSDDGHLAVYCTTSCGKCPVTVTKASMERKFPNGGLIISAPNVFIQ